MSNNKISKFDFEPVSEVYDKTYWKRIQPDIEKMINEALNSQVPMELIASQKKEYNEWLEAEQKFVKGCNDPEYKRLQLLRPFAYMCFYKPGKKVDAKLRELEQKYLSNEKSKLKEEKDLLEVNSMIASLIAPSLIISKVNREILKYYDLGPLNNTFYRVIKDYWKGAKTSRMLENSRFRNTLNSSWGIFNNNIIVNTNYKKHEMVERVYYPNANNVSSIVRTFYLNDKTPSNMQSRYNVQNSNLGVRKPFPRFTTVNKTWCFSTQNKDLEFNYKDYYSNSFRDKKPEDNKYTPFENPTFESHYLFDRNDEVGIRTVFTPWAQENYIKINECKAPLPEYQFIKQDQWYGTRLNTRELNNCFLDDSPLFTKFSTDPFFTSGKFKYELINSILKQIFIRYQSIAFMTMIPSIRSEEQIDIINEIDENRFKDSKVSIGDANQAFYIVNKIYNVLWLNKYGIFKRYDTETMQYINDLSAIQKHSTKAGTYFTSILMKNYSYEAVIGFENISSALMDELRKELGQSLSEVLPVNYYDYYRRVNDALLFFAPVSRSLYIHSPNNHNLDDTSIKYIKENFIKKYEDKFVIQTLRAKKGYLAIFAKDSAKGEREQLSKIFGELVDYMNSESKFGNKSSSKIMNALLMTEFYQEQQELAQYQKELDEKQKSLEEQVSFDEQQENSDQE